MRSLLLQLLELLADEGITGAHTDQEPDQRRAARGALAIAVQTALASPETKFRSVSAPQCPNCGEPGPGKRTPYCSDCCRGEAAYTRQFRASLLNQAVQQEERQVMLGQNFWRALGGGMPARVALLTQKDLDRLFRSRGGKCEVCGGTPTSADNIGSG